MPIGRPIAEHPCLRPRRARGGRCPVGVPASCTSAATGVARGYLGRPGADRGAVRRRPVRRGRRRMYRTGDLRAPAAPTACSSSSAASTTRSRSAASGSSRARSRRCSRRTRACATRRGRRARTARRAPRWSPTSCRRAASTAEPAAPRSPAPAARATWCRRPFVRARRAAAHAERQARPAGAAGARTRRRRRRPPAAAPPTSRRPLAGVWAELLGLDAGRRRRRLLRPRRPLAAGHAGRRPGPQPLRRSSCRCTRCSRPDGGRAGRRGPAAVGRGRRRRPLGAARLAGGPVGRGGRPPARRRRRLISGGGPPRRRPGGGRQRGARRAGRTADVAAVPGRGDEAHLHPDGFAHLRRLASDVPRSRGQAVVGAASEDGPGQAPATSCPAA